jgi:hypothetical protein
VARRVLQRYRQVVAPATRDAARLELLTERTHDALADGPRHNERRDRGRPVSLEPTVKIHVGSTFSKLGVRDRPDAIVFA